MAIPARAANTGTFFVTSRTYNHRRLFQVAKNAELFLETLQHYRALGRYKLYDFVAMPDHIHLLLTPQEITLERAIGLNDFDEHRRYIRENPVAGRLVERADDYPYSSVYRGSNPATDLSG